MSSTEGAGSEGSGGGVSHQLATLVPTFDPAVDDVTTWSNKVELLLAAWPENKIVELATRLILNTKGSAFQKLQLKQKEILINDPKGIRRLVELVGGTWGQVPLENRYELAEKALFRCQQKVDESGDSYIARVDVVWTELLAKSLSLDQLMAYVLLRGSRLSAEDKKRVLVESGAEGTSKTLEWSKVVAAIRMLSSNFFQEYTGGKREKSQKTYDHMAFATDDIGDEEQEEEVFWTSDEMLDEETIATLASEHDDDANMILQFEDAITEAVQNDTELAAFFSSYQDARRRLTERVKFRGFWPVKKFGKSSGKKGSKGGHKGGRMTLAQKIANSNCRICGKKGHWKSECPKRGSGSQGSSPTASTSIPTSFVTTDDLPAAVMEIPMMPIPDSQHENGIEVAFGVSHWEYYHNRWVKGVRNTGIDTNSLTKAIRDSLRNKMSLRRSPMTRSVQNPSPSKGSCPNHHTASPKMSVTTDHPSICDVHFASSGTSGVVDLGASQTVIGSKQVVELLEGLPKDIWQQVRREPCHLVFRFGNHQTLTSKQALMFPLHDQWFRVAVVPGPTPFLLSSTFLNQIRAVIDTEAGTLWSKMLKKQLVLERTAKNLFLMDVNQLWEPTATACLTTSVGPDEVQKPAAEMPCQDVHLGNQHEKKGSQPSCPVMSTGGSGTMRLPSDTHGHVLFSQGNREKSDRSSSEPCDRVPSCNSNVQPGRPVQGLQQSQQECPSGSQQGCLESHDSGGARDREDRIWRSQEGSDVQGCLLGRAMDRIHTHQVREERQTGAYDVCPLCDPPNEARPDSGDQKCQRGPKTPSEPATASFDVWTELQDPETMNVISCHPAELVEDMGMLRQENQNLAHRMGQVEMMMQEVLEHLRRSSVKTENWASWPMLKLKFWMIEFFVSNSFWMHRLTWTMISSRKSSTTVFIARVNDSRSNF